MLAQISVSSLPRRDNPRSLDPETRCYWYRSTQFPYGNKLCRSWTIEYLKAYVGGFDPKGKSLLDVETASGYLAFNAARTGATVTALDGASTREFRLFPFADNLSFPHVREYRAMWERENLATLKNSWLLAWQRCGSAHHPSIIAILRGTETARMLDASGVVDPMQPAPGPVETLAPRRRGLLSRLRRG